MKRNIKNNLFNIVTTSTLMAALFTTGFIPKGETLLDHYSIIHTNSVYGSTFEKPEIELLEIKEKKSEIIKDVSVQIELMNDYSIIDKNITISDNNTKTEQPIVQKTVLSKSPMRSVVNGADYAPLDKSITNKSTSYLSFNGKTTAAVLGYNDTFDRTGSKGDLIGQFTATAYDTSHGEYATATSIVVSSRSLEDIKIIAVDPKIIPLMSKVYIEFPEPYTHLNGVYMAADTGGKINQNVIDVFWGDFGRNTPQSLWDFGRREGIKIYTVK